MAGGRQKQGDTKGLKAATGVEPVCTLASYLANGSAQPPLQPQCPVCHPSGHLRTASCYLARLLPQWSAAP